jgi:hypothetical protein
MPTNSVAFRYCKLAIESVANYPALKEKFKSFVQFKEQTPTQSWGSSDTPFTGKGILANYVPGLKHAHLSRDVSVVYKVGGRDPIYIDIYGFFSHAELGTGTPANTKKQQSIGGQFARQEFK